MASHPSVDFVPVEDEPLHVERWRRPNIRLVHAQFPPHTSCLWHQHVRNSVYVVLEPLEVMEHAYDREPKPLVQPRGAVFCRDHSLDRLLHTAKTGDMPASLVLIEMLKEKDEVLPHEDEPVMSGTGVKLLHDAAECRVYRLTLSAVESGPSEDPELPSDDLVIKTASESVLVAVDACEIKVSSAEGGFTRTLGVGDDVVLAAGDHRIALVRAADQTTTVELVLTEVF